MQISATELRQAVPQPDGYSLDEGVVYLSQPYKVWE